MQEKSLKFKSRENAYKKIVNYFKKQNPKKIEKIDGMSFYFDNYWCNIRISKTEPFLRFNMEANNQKILEEMRDVDEDDRTAAYHCVLALVEYEDDPVPLICHGIWEGSILFEPRGNNGFGYDPIFYVPTHRCSAAELTTTEKNSISHRGQVVDQLLEVFHSLIENKH